MPRALRVLAATLFCVAVQLLSRPDAATAAPEDLPTCALICADSSSADHSKWTPPEDIAKVVSFLLSDLARRISGASIPIS